MRTNPAAAAAAKAAALWSERSSGESNDGMSGTNCLRGSIADRLHNTKFDSESARSMVRMVRRDSRQAVGCHVHRDNLFKDHPDLLIAEIATSALRGLVQPAQHPSRLS